MYEAPRQAHLFSNLCLEGKEDWSELWKAEEKEIIASGDRIMRVKLTEKVQRARSMISRKLNKLCSGIDHSQKNCARFHPSRPTIALYQLPF